MCDRRRHHARAYGLILFQPVCSVATPSRPQNSRTRRAPKARSRIPRYSPTDVPAARSAGSRRPAAAPASAVHPPPGRRLVRDQCEPYEKLNFNFLRDITPVSGRLVKLPLGHTPNTLGERGAVGAEMTARRESVKAVLLWRGMIEPLTVEVRHD